MGLENQQTLQSYESSTAAFIARATSRQTSPKAKEWLDLSLRGLAPDASILEIGSAGGRDALYIKSQGYKVQCSDAAAGFVSHLQEQGHEAFLADTVTRTYDFIFANAVLLHFTRLETELVLEKIINALTPKGRFSFTLKAGEGEKWADNLNGTPRYFCFWNTRDIQSLLTQTGFVDVCIEELLTPEHPDPWLFIRASKKV